MQRVVQPADDLGRHDVRRVLIAEGASLNTDDEAEGLDMLGELREREGDRFALVEIVEFEGLEVADQDVARFLALGERIEVLARLIVGPRQIASCALLLDESEISSPFIGGFQSPSTWGDLARPRLATLR